MGEAASATEALGRFVAESRFEALPEALRHEGRRSILNHIGCALGVARDPAVITALEIMREASPILWQGLRATLLLSLLVVPLGLLGGIILAVLLAAGILTLPSGGDASTVSAGIAGVCFGAAAMLMVFRFGKKQPEDVK